MRVGYFQFAPRLCDPDYNRARMKQAIEASDARLFVLPELANSGYNFSSVDQVRRCAEEFPQGETLALWREAAVRRRMIIVGGFAERAGERLYNSAAVACPDGTMHLYRKIHLFGREPDFFAPGDRPLRVLEVDGIRLGVMICFDWAFPEVARILALDGAEILCHPSNIITVFPQQAMITRGVENRVFTVTANRVGEEQGAAGRLRFRGLSQITSPDGKVLVSSGEAAEEWRSVEVDLAASHDKRLAGYVDLFAARRPQMYGRLVEQR